MSRIAAAVDRLLLPPGLDLTPEERAQYLESVAALRGEVLRNLNEAAMLSVRPRMLRYAAAETDRLRATGLSEAEAREVFNSDGHRHALALNQMLDEETDRIVRRVRAVAGPSPSSEIH
jgi:hypothetical protein